MSNYIKKVLLIGTGYMAKEYAKVIIKLVKKDNLTVIGRGAKNNKNFYNEFGIKPKNNLNEYLINKSNNYNYAIVAVGIEELYDVCKILIKFKIKNILLEKPGALYLKQLVDLIRLQKKYKNRIHIAFNRRYYNSTIEAKKLIILDGGIKSFKFDFTERSHLISREKTSIDVKQQWFMANSIHVIDLAFYLGGLPRKIINYSYDKVSWHRNGAIFTGSGISKKNALFSYHANWKTPGRWSLDFFTSNKHLIFKPLEELSFINRKFKETKINFKDKDDFLFKPGLYKMTNVFLKGTKTSLPSLKDHTLNIKKYYRFFLKNNTL
tara:strand:+ start:9352 stop:10317 length:966 start_codon:yes stop_codon:yes gene_type:complete